MRCDLHIHSCLSPCADEDMTPYNLVAMAALKGLNLIALTDHNSARNCPAAAEVAAGMGLGFIPGMEVTTSEEIHVVCLFPSLEAALDMDALVYRHLPPIVNRPDIFGHQRVMDHQDGVLSEEPRLLINACTLSLTELPRAVQKRGGLLIPAHVTRPSGGILPILGAFPADLEADGYEHHRSDLPDPALKALRRLHSSDAHRLPDILEADAALPLPLCTPDFAGLRDFLHGRAHGFTS
jgi:hypothetical protein